jgi:hypothetical protein
VLARNVSAVKTNKEPRHCLAMTRAGKPCKAPPIKMTDRCLAHSAAKTRESVGFVAANGKAGRHPSPHVVDVLRERVEADIDRWIAPYEDALTATRDGAPDHGLRMRAAEAVLDRAYGKATQRAEVEVEDEDRTPAPFDRVLAAEVEEAFNAAYLPEGMERGPFLPSLSGDQKD